MGRFIVFEGPDGSGKSTQVGLLAAALKHRGFNVVTTREPGGTAVGDAIRGLILDASGPSMHPLTRVFLLNAARAELVEDVIKPARARGAVVISDRFSYSTLAYQSAGEGVDSMTVRMLADVATQGVEPDLVILLDLAPEEGIRRKAASELNQLDRRPDTFHALVHRAYREMADASPERWLCLDGRRPVDELAEAVLERTLNLLHANGGAAYPVAAP